MTFLKWTDQYRTGVDVIDDQHRRIFELINLLHEEPGRLDATAIQGALLAYVTDHFRDEEALMAYTHYPGRVEHVQEHQALLGSVLTMERSGTEADALAEFAKCWVTAHIETQDRPFIEWVRQHRGGAD